MATVLVTLEPQDLNEAIRDWMRKHGYSVKDNALATFRIEKADHGQGEYTTATMFAEPLLVERIVFTGRDEKL